MNGFTSPRVGWRFEVKVGRLTVYGHDGRPLQNPAEIMAARDALRKERAAAAAERDAERVRAAAPAERATRLAARLRELGLDPDAG